MPLDESSPLTDAPAFTTGVALAADGDSPVVGYECAMPWFHMAVAPVADPVRAADPDHPAA